MHLVVSQKLMTPGMSFILVLTTHALSFPLHQNQIANVCVSRYGQEEPGERLEILQQPLALGYLTSTARTGPLPRWSVSHHIVIINITEHFSENSF